MTACPGSGKTFVLRERAVRKLKEDRHSVGVAVTFTREAARELESRVMLAYPEAGGRLVCGTFHSLCMRQLRETGIEVNLVSDAQAADLLARAWNEVRVEWDEQELDAIAADAPFFAGKRFSFEAVQVFVSMMKSMLHPPVRSPDECPFSAVFLRYQELLKRRSAMDFNDMLVMATRKMATGEVAPLVGHGGFLLVDEAQDGDAVQMGWVRAHMQQGAEVVAVGDDDQNLYCWRFAGGYGAMEGFLKWAKAEHISLDVTYRCAREILSPAAKLIAHNVERIDKQLRTANHSLGTVEVVACTNLQSQIERMADFISAHGQPDQWAVICRTNRIADDVDRYVRGLREAGGGFPLSKQGGKAFWDLPGPALYLAMCSSLWFDNLIGFDAALRRIGVSERRLSQLHMRFPPRRRGSLQAWLAKGMEDESDKERLFRTMSSQWRQAMARRALPLATQGMLSFMLSHMDLSEAGRREPGPPSKLMVASLEGAQRSIASLARAQGTLGQRLNALTMDVAERPAEPTGAVRLLTFHSSKGLEFDNVWMLACDATVIPSRNSHNIEEERRLFYVGMTRARYRLMISHTATKASQFIEEAGL